MVRRGIDVTARPRFSTSIAGLRPGNADCILPRICGRYITPDEAALEREWATLPRDIEYFPSYNFAPTMRGPVAIERDGERRVELMTWGFQPHWAKRAWINARAETVFEARAFAEDTMRHRCLVIAAGWYEWTGDKAPRQPHLFRRTDGRSFAFAGIWTNRKVEDEWMSTYAILTTDANELSAPIHDRTPLVMDPAHYDVWIARDAEQADISAILHRVPDGREFEVLPVSKAVNSPKNNSPELVNRVALSA
jgi:putative SOS response-associated peptidase YedK